MTIWIVVKNGVLLRGFRDKSYAISVVRAMIRQSGEVCKDELDTELAIAVCPKTVYEVDFVPLAQ